MPPSVIAVDGLIPGCRATVEGRVKEVDDIRKGGRTARAVVIGDESGDLRITFTHRHAGTDIQPGQLLQVTGKARRSGNRPVWMSNPSYRVVQTPLEAPSPS